MRVEQTAEESRRIVKILDEAGRMFPRAVRRILRPAPSLPLPFPRRERLALTWLSAVSGLATGRADYRVPILGADFSCDPRRNDHWILDEVFGVPPAYGTDFDDAIVVDVGAHKGYFAAHAFLNGAKRVVSYEPEAANFAAIAEAAASLTERGNDWRVHHKAVGSAAETATLYVCHGTSFGHSLTRPDDAADEETVDVVAIADVLADAHGSGERLIVKLDPEGAECTIVLDSPREAWDAVSEVLVDLWDCPCTEALTARLAEMGFVSRDNPIPWVLRARRTVRA
jgi:FkbM family methyltransferase